VRRLEISGGCKTTGGKGGVDLWRGVDALFEGVGGQEPENKLGKGIDPQNPNIERAGSISVGGYK
jgi:hypothetical protein